MKNLYALASSSPKSLGHTEMTQSAPLFIHLYCVDTGPRDENINASPVQSPKMSSAGNRLIVAIYKQRMQIKKYFRDVKSEHLELPLDSGS